MSAALFCVFAFGGFFAGFFTRFFFGFTGSSFVGEQFVFDAIDEGHPRRFDHVFADAYGAEEVVRADVAEFDRDADFGGGCSSGIDNADFVIDEPDVFDVRVVGFERAD